MEKFLSKGTTSKMNTTTVRFNPPLRKKMGNSMAASRLVCSGLLVRHGWVNSPCLIGASQSL